MRRWWLFALALSITACGYGASQGPYRAPGIAGGDADGAVLYARNCAWCHGTDGAGTANGPTLNGELDGGAYTHFMVSSGRMPISTPESPSVRSAVAFTQTEIDALVAFVETFGGTGPPVPQPDLSAGSAPRGLELYLTNCAACHSSTGTGGALTSGVVAPPLDDPAISSTQIAEAVLVGPGCRDDPDCGPGSGAMPHFDFSDDQINDLVAYVGSLQEANNPGGWSIDRVGPVTEGAVAWLVGLIAMLAVGRWIGTKVGDKS